MRVNGYLFAGGSVRIKEVVNMKKIKIYINKARTPICKFESEGGEVMFHQISNHILMLRNADIISGLEKVRIIIE